jgi:hypothetical protein
MTDPLITAAAISGGASIFGGVLGNNSSKKRTKRSHEYNKELLTLGNQLDMDNQKEMFDYRIQQGLDAGLTPWEVYGGPAGGAGGGTTGSGQVLGNNATQIDAAAMQAEQQRIQQGVGLLADLAKTEMQIEGQKDVAEIQNEGSLAVANVSATTQTAIAEMRNAIEKGRLDLDTRQFEEIALDIAEAELNISREQYKKVKNEVTTSSPAFQREMKRLSMGLDNLLVEYAIKKFGVDPTSSRADFLKIPEKDREAFYDFVMMGRSKIFTESKGLSESDFMQDIGTTLGNMIGGIDQGARNIFGGYQSAITQMLGTKPKSAREKRNIRTGR